eukprot:2886618-Prymnesium_polylepis.1
MRRLGHADACTLQERSQLVTLGQWDAGRQHCLDEAPAHEVRVDRQGAHVLVRVVLEVLEQLALERGVITHAHSQLGTGKLVGYGLYMGLD